MRRPNGDLIGHIERLMIDKVSGKVSYAVLSFGGFLGMGTNLLPLPWGRLTYNPGFGAYELDIGDEELKRAPTFRADKDFDWVTVRRRRSCTDITGYRRIGAGSERGLKTSQSRNVAARACDVPWN